MTLRFDTTNFIQNVQKSHPDFAITSGFFHVYARNPIKYHAVTIKEIGNSYEYRNSYEISTSYATTSYENNTSNDTNITNENKNSFESKMYDIQENKKKNVIITNLFDNSTKEIVLDESWEEINITQRLCTHVYNCYRPKCMEMMAECLYKVQSAFCEELRSDFIGCRPFNLCVYGRDLSVKSGGDWEEIKCVHLCGKNRKNRNILQIDENKRKK